MSRPPINRWPSRPVEGEVPTYDAEYTPPPTDPRQRHMAQGTTSYDAEGCSRGFGVITLLVAAAVGAGAGAGLYWWFTSGREHGLTLSILKPKAAGETRAVGILGQSTGELAPPKAIHPL